MDLGKVFFWAEAHQWSLLGPLTLQRLLDDSKHSVPIKELYLVGNPAENCKFQLVMVSLPFLPLV